MRERTRYFHKPIVYMVVDYSLFIMEMMDMLLERFDM
jgi:hypothetical protein